MSSGTVASAVKTVVREEAPAVSPAPTPVAPGKGPAATLGQRLMSLDAFRGFIMVMMISDGLGFDRVAAKFTGGGLAAGWWHFLASQFDHRKWHGCAAWDLIQPSFMFMVGVALPFSLASRRAKGTSWGRIWAHAWWRSLLLVLLAVLFITNARGESRTDWSFTNVLAQIGLGYWFLYLVAGRGWKVQVAVIAAILAGYWALFALHPLPGESFNYAAVGVKANFPNFSGWAAHWSHGPNFAEDFDRWFLNLFPQPGPEPFKYNTFGYSTLNFLPSLCTMIIGVMTGEMLRGSRTMAGKLRAMILAGVGLVVGGMMLDPNLVRGIDHAWTICPAVKVIYTPTFVVYSTGWCLLMLAFFYWAMELKGWKKWGVPLVIVGANSIGVYLMYEFCGEWILRTVKAHLGTGMFEGTYGPVAEKVAVLAVLWGVCWWMWRRKIFLKI